MKELSSSQLIALRALLQHAGEAILRHYNEKTDAQTKLDGSPVTQADLASEAVIIEQLKIITPEIPVVSEESFEPVLARPSTYWLVDPLDGTKEFLANNGEFAINLCLIDNNTLHYAAIYAVTSRQTYIALKGQGTYVYDDNSSQGTKLYVNSQRSQQPTIVVSRSHALYESELINRMFPGANVEPLGSSLKFCRIASGAADVYLRQSACMEWDTAAGQLLVEEAGGVIQTLTGEALTYGKTRPVQPGFIASGYPISLPPP